MIQNVRFFSYCYDDESEPDICDISEQTFIELSGRNDSRITYQRNSVYENGVNQVCLTVEPYSYPLQSEVQL